MQKSFFNTSSSLFNDLHLSPDMFEIKGNTLKLRGPHCERGCCPRCMRRRKMHTEGGEGGEEEKKKRSYKRRLPNPAPPPKTYIPEEEDGEAFIKTLEGMLRASKS